jgi:hypothetical protein
MDELVMNTEARSAFYAGLIEGKYGRTEGLAPRPAADRVLALRAEPPAASHRSALRPTGAVPRKGHHVFTEAECWPDDPDYETWLYEMENR